MSRPLLIYTQTSTPRLEYVLDHIFNKIYQYPFECITELNYQPGMPIDINYSNKDLPGITIRPQTLLFETNIRRCEPSFTQWKGHIVPKFTEEPHEQFDLFASVFFMLSRYEEHYFPKTDLHSRPYPEKLWQGKYEVLDKPIVDIWLNTFRSDLMQAFGISIKTYPFTALSTIDIDNGYRFKGKGIKRIIGGSLKDLKTLRFKQFSERWQTILGLRTDDFDIYEELINWHKESKVPLKCFILNAKKGGHDHGLPRNGRAIKKLITYLRNNKVELGIHPSYSSNRHDVRLYKEINGLKDLLNAPVNCSRQHYLRLNIKQTYPRLISVGITNDYTMGFASNVGFRAGTSRPFLFYNLDEERTTKLLLHPFTLMEGAYKDYLSVHAVDAGPKIKQLIDQVEEVGGCFISIWHEAQLSKRSNWRKVYKQMIADLDHRLRSQPNT